MTDSQNTQRPAPIDGHAWHEMLMREQLALIAFLQRTDQKTGHAYKRLHELRHGATTTKHV